MKKYVRSVYRLVRAAAADPVGFGRAINAVPSIRSGLEFAERYEEGTREHAGAPLAPKKTALWDAFQHPPDARRMQKWEHYFDIYHHHFARFVGRRVNVLEIGIGNGASLAMWRAYFGSACQVYGVDINPACKAHANDHTSIFIGDQANRGFWSEFRRSVQALDVIVDDGGHAPEQQQVTVEEMLPHLSPGGVYLIEDVHGVGNRFAGYLAGLVNQLNRADPIVGPDDRNRVSPFQASVHSIHFYPYVVVIEKHAVPRGDFSAPWVAG